MLKFKFDIRWKTSTAGVAELDPRLLPLLRAIREGGSLKHAATVCDISYRFAWELFRQWHQHFGKPLVLFERGRGAKLSELGEKLLWAEQLLGSRLQPDLDSVAEELNHELDSLLQAQTTKANIRIHASHDLTISCLEELAHQSPLFAFDFRFRGSLECLRQLAGGQCDVAGFHFPRGELSAALKPRYQYWLDERKVQLLQLATRQQGLMCAAGNPLHLAGMQDLARRSIRFINRQKDSGTRLIFDELLRYKGINKGKIRGYNDAEFTHLAVAAMLASGAADAGFGIKAAASQFALHFIPVVEESYVLAIRRGVAASLVSEMKNLLRSTEFNRKIKSLPGYTAVHTGKLISIDKLLAGK